MTLKAKIILAVIALTISFAFGRFSAPESVKIQKETTVNDVKTDNKKETANTDTDRDRHRETVTTEVTHPDGTVEKTTKTTDDSTTKRTTQAVTETADTDVLSQKITESKEVTRRSAPVTVSLLAGVSLSLSSGLSAGPLAYGASITRPILGPITVGIFGLSTGVGGASLGLTF